MSISKFQRKQCKTKKERREGKAPSFRAGWVVAAFHLFSQQQSSDAKNTIQGDTISRSLILSAQSLPTWSTSRSSGVRSPAHVLVIRSITSSPLASLENSFRRQFTHAVTGSYFSLEKTGYSILLNSHFTKMIFSLCPRLCPNQDLCLQGQTFPHGPAST